MSSGELEHTLLPKTIALPVFASDPLSSNAYATQEAMLVLGTAGTASGALGLTIPISIAVACVLAIVVSSYRQTVHAYPAGGGAYRVSAENLGMWPGLLAAAALLGDYVLTVAVSITAGVDAIASALPPVDDHRVLVAIGFVILVTLANLRGVRESGTLFAIPTYGFVASIYLLLIVGFVKCAGGCPQAESAGDTLKAIEPLGFFLILKAFAAGTTALTGVEAIADGTAAFRYPQSKNAATTLSIMGALTISMFLGISWLADHTNVVFHHDAGRTVVAQIGAAIYGEGFLFYVLQVMTAAILILAANTAYQDFPRLSSILANDNFMPRQFRNRGDRLVFSNGVIILATFASILIWAFDAELNALIQLYLIGVFISFTLSQTGLVRRFRKVQPPGWKSKAIRSGFGACVTGVVLIVIVQTKFLGGAWIILASIPVIMFGMYSVHSHYVDVTRQLAHPARRPTDRRPTHQRFVVYVPKVDAATARAVGYVRSVPAAEWTAVTFDSANDEAWRRLAPDIPLVLLERVGHSNTKSIRNYLRERRRELETEDFLTFVVPEVLQTRGLLEVIRHPRMHRLKASLLSEAGVQVLDIPLPRSDTGPMTTEEAQEPGRNFALVMVSGTSNAVLQAIEYAETLRPTDLRAVSFGLEPEAVEKLGDDWLLARIPHPLEIEAAPFRDIGSSVIQYVRQFNADGVDRVVTVVIPEFVVPKRRHQVLHGQTALIVKRHLLFEPGVVVVSVPYHLD
jgi:amino acid transporter